MEVIAKWTQNVIQLLITMKMAKWNIFAGGIPLLLYLSLFCSSGVSSERNASKIVFLPLPIVGSQYFNMLAIAEEVERRGNEVTIFSTQHLKKRKSPVHHIDYELHTNTDFFKEIDKLTSGTTASSLFGYFSIGKQVLELQYDCCVDMLQNNDTRNAIVEADLIVIMSVLFCGPYIADIYDKPFIVVHPGPLPAVGSFTQVPLPPSYIPMAGASVSENMNFLQRTKNFIMSNVKHVGMDFVVTSYFQSLHEKFNGKSLESYSRLFGKAESYIITTDFAFEFVHPTMPDVIVTGPVTTKPASKLSIELEEYMQSSGEHGVVVISFGSAIMHLNENVIQNIIAAVSRLRQKFIWKIQVKEQTEIPENLKVVDWLPQNDLLGHPKTRAFVSHMGINGATEAAYHGVPIVAACLMSDSFANTVKFKEKAKMAKFIDVYNANSDTWQKSIEEVIYNSSYKENALRTSKLMRSLPRTSVQRAGDVIQYAIDNGGRLPHLKSYSSNLYWFQYHCIDVIFFIFAVCCFVSVLVYKLTKGLLAFACGGRKREKTD